MSLFFFPFTMRLCLCDDELFAFSLNKSLFMDFFFGFLLCESAIRSCDAFVLCLVLGRFSHFVFCGFVSFVQVRIFNSMACFLLCVCFSIFENINHTNDAF